jgi:hypothetical protein
VLVLLMRGTCDVLPCDGLRHHDILEYVPHFMKIGTVVQATVRICLRYFNNFNVCITDRRGCAVEKASCDMIHIPNFVKIGNGVQLILIFCPRNSRGCNIGITDGGV